MDIVVEIAAIRFFFVVQFSRGLASIVRQEFGAKKRVDEDKERGEARVGVCARVCVRVRV